MPQTTYMVVEHFRNGDAVPVYRRFRERGRMTPTRCYQLMEAPNQALLEQWIASWSDLVEFEVHPVITSKEASERIGPKL